MDSRGTLVEHSWNTRGTLVEHVGPLGFIQQCWIRPQTLVEHPWNTPGRPRYGKPGARLAILRLVTSSNPDRTWFCIFPSRSQVRVRVVQKNFQVVMGSNPGLCTLLSTFAVVTGSSPGRAKRWSFYRRFHDVPLVFHECSTSVGSTLVEHRGVSWSRGTPVEHPWNIVDPDPPDRHAVCE